MATLWALVTAMAYAVADVIIGQVCKKKNPIFVALPISAGILIFFLAAGLLGPGIHLEAKSLHYGIAIGILYAVANIIFYKALAIGPMATVSACSSLAPLVPVIFDVLTGNAPSPIQTAGFLLIIGGIWLVSMRGGLAATRSATRANPFVLAIPASLLYGVIDVLFELGDNASMLGFLVVIQVAKLLTSVPLALLAIRQVGPQAIPVMKLIPIGFIYGIGWIALDLSARQGLIDITSSLEYSSPFFVAILAYLFLAEYLTKKQIIGLASALLGVTFLVSHTSQNHESSTAHSNQWPPIHHHYGHRIR